MALSGSSPSSSGRASDRLRRSSTAVRAIGPAEASGAIAGITHSSGRRSRLRSSHCCRSLNALRMAKAAIARGSRVYPLQGMKLRRAHSAAVSSRPRSLTSNTEETVERSMPLGASGGTRANALITRGSRSWVTRSRAPSAGSSPWAMALRSLGLPPVVPMSSAMKAGGVLRPSSKRRSMFASIGRTWTTSVAWR